MNFQLRAVRPSDFAAIHALQRRVEGHDRIPYTLSLAEFEEWEHDPHLDLTADTRLAEGDEGPIAWGCIRHRPSGEREERAQLFGAVDPAHRGRGIGRALLAWQVERATAILRAASATLPRFVQVNLFDFELERIQLCRSLGLEPVRWSHDMIAPLDTLPSAPAPAGIAIVPWGDAWSEAARVTMNEAFAIHWGSTPRDPATWAHEIAAHGSRSDLSFLALDRDRVAGVTRNCFFPDDEVQSGRREGWIMNLGVAESYRRRGIAAALIAASLAAFRSEGFTHARLGVDIGNESGANRLYERMGFHTMYRSAVHQRQV
jgi:ribosomal protein S18 acetylase RimI-like enzyme